MKIHSFPSMIYWCSYWQAKEAYLALSKWPRLLIFRDLVSAINRFLKLCLVNSSDIAHSLCLPAFWLQRAGKPGQTWAEEWRFLRHLVPVTMWGLVHRLFDISADIQMSLFFPHFLFPGLELSRFSNKRSLDELGIVMLFSAGTFPN